MRAARSGSLVGMAAVVVVAGLGWLGCSDSPSGPAPRGAISGAVREGDTGVAGATLSLAGGATRTVTSGANGSFSFADLAAGSYTVGLTPPAGYVLAAGEVGSKAVTVAAGQTAAVSFAVSVATGSIAGTVRNGQAGVGGATVALSGPGGNRSVVTAGAGTFAFADLAPGAYALTVTPPAGFQLDAGETATKNTAVTAGQATTVNFALAPVTGGNVVFIEVAGLTFSPAVTTVARGTTVRWVNGSTMFHTVTPDGHAAWTSANLPAGATFEHTFNTAGTFAYYCNPHRDLGMTGTINVQ